MSVARLGVVLVALTLAVAPAKAYSPCSRKGAGPHSGQALAVNYRYLPDFQDGGTLSQEVSAEARLYLPVTRRSNFAIRAFMPGLLALRA